MIPIRRSWVAALCLMLPAILLPASLLAQGPRIGLALSGGGAKGLTHIGVLKVIDESGLRIDPVSGTSFGSVVGSLYALGYSGAAIESLVMAEDWSKLLTDRRDRALLPMLRKWNENRFAITLPIDRGRVQLPGGVVEGENMGVLLSRLTIPVPHNADFSRLPIPFAAIATDIATGEAVVLTKGDLGDAVRASVSLPFVFTPITIDGRLLVDGGLVRNFPAEDAGRMETDVVIGVDIGAPQLKQEEIQDFLQVITQALFFADEADRRLQRALCDILILPDIAGVSLLDFTDPLAVIRRGEEAARKFRPQFDSLARLQGRPPDRMRLSVPPYLTFDSILVAGATPFSQRVITAELGLPLHSRVTPEEIDRAMDRIAALGTYRAVSYRVRRGERGDTLLIRPRQQHGGVVQVGLRYDSHDQASVLFNGTWNNVFGELSTGSIDLRLGEQKMLEAAAASPLWFSAGLGGRAALSLRENILAGSPAGSSNGEMVTRSASLTLSAGSFYTRSFLLSASARMEVVGSSLRTGTPDSLRVDRYAAHAFLAAFDNTDRPHLPQAGITAFGGIDGAVAPLASGGRFSRCFGWIRGAARITRGLFSSAEIFAGTSRGAGLPPHYLYRLGGLRTPTFLPYERFVRLSVLGFQSHELIGRHAAAAHAAIHVEPSAEIVISLRCSAAMADNAPAFHPAGKHFEAGIGLTGSYLSPVGPMEFTLMSGSEHQILTFVTLGVEF